MVGMVVVATAHTRQTQDKHTRDTRETQTQTQTLTFNSEARSEGGRESNNFDSQHTHTHTHTHNTHTYITLFLTWQLPCHVISNTRDTNMRCVCVRCVVLFGVDDDVVFVTV